MNLRCTVFVLAVAVGLPLTCLAQQAAPAAIQAQPAAPTGYPQQTESAAYPQQTAPTSYPQPVPSPYPQPSAPSPYPEQVVPAQYTQQAIPVQPAQTVAPIMVNARIGDPNYYGQIDLANNPTPPLVYSTPAIAQPAPPGLVYPPLYLRVPPVYYQNWPYYCGYYNACSYPVFFVQESWYLGWYSPWYVRLYPRGRPGFVIRVGYQSHFVPRGQRPHGEWDRERR